MPQIAGLDAERALVSSLCHAPELFGSLPVPFSPSAFTDSGARILYETLRSMWLENKKISFDLIRLSVGAHLDLVSLEALWDFVPSGANFEQYLAVVLTNGRLRSCIIESKSFLASLIEDSQLLDSSALEALIESHKRALAAKCLGPQKLQTIQEQVVDFNAWISTAS